MAYVLQSFSSGAILTNSQLWRTEENIATHVHGLDGVTGAGISIRREDKTQAFTVQPSDSGKLFDCYVQDNAYTGTFQPAGTLGDNFAIMFKNRSTSLPVLLLAASGQTIDGRSGYLLCPLESVSIFSNSAGLSTGATTDPVIIVNRAIPSSVSDIEIDMMDYANHFSMFELITSGVIGYQTGGGASPGRMMLLRVSIDSLQSYLGDGQYVNSDLGGNTNFIAFMNANYSGDYCFTRFNPGSDASTPVFAVFDTANGSGYLGISIAQSQNVNFASIDSAGVIHGLSLYSSGDHLYSGYGGAGAFVMLRAYGRK